VWTFPQVKQDPPCSSRAGGSYSHPVKRKKSACWTHQSVERGERGGGFNSPRRGGEDPLPPPQGFCARDRPPRKKGIDVLFHAHEGGHCRGGLPWQRGKGKKGKTAASFICPGGKTNSGIQPACPRKEKKEKKGTFHPVPGIEGVGARRRDRYLLISRWPGKGKPPLYPRTRIKKGGTHSRQPPLLFHPKERKKENQPSHSSQKGNQGLQKVQVSTSGLTMKPAEKKRNPPSLRSEGGYWQFHFFHRW